MRQPQPDAVKPKINVELDLLKHGMKHSPPIPPSYNPVPVPPCRSIEHTTVDPVSVPPQGAGNVSTSFMSTKITQPETPPPSSRPPPPPVPSRSPPVQRAARVQFATPVQDTPLEHAYHVKSELTIDIAPPDYYVIPTGNYTDDQGLLLTKATKSAVDEIFTADSMKTSKERAQQLSNDSESDGSDDASSYSSTECETSDEKQTTDKVDNKEQKKTFVSVPYKLLKSEKEEINVKDKMTVSDFHKLRTPLNKENISSKDGISMLETYRENKAGKQESNVKDRISLKESFQESTVDKKLTNTKDKILVSELYKENSNLDKKIFDVQDYISPSETYKGKKGHKEEKDKTSKSDSFEERVTDEKEMSIKDEVSTSELHKGISSYLSSSKDLVSTSETTSKVVKESVTVSEKTSVLKGKEFQEDEKLKEVMEIKNILSSSKPLYITKQNSNLKSTISTESSQVCIEKETLPVYDIKEHVYTSGSSVHVHKEKENFTDYSKMETMSVKHDMKKVTTENSNAPSISHYKTQTSSSVTENQYSNELDLPGQFVGSAKVSNLPKPQRPLLKQNLGLSKSVETLDTTGYSTLPSSPAKQWTHPGQDSSTVPRTSKTVRFDNGSAVHSRHVQCPQPAPPLPRDLRRDFYQSMPSLNSPSEHEVLRTSISETPHPAHVEYTTIQSPSATATYQTSFAPSPLHPDYAYYGIPRFSGHFQYPATSIPPVIHGQIPGKQVIPSGIAYIPVPVSSYGTPIPTFYPHNSSLPPHASAPGANLPTYHLVPYPPTPTSPQQYPIMSVPLAQLMDSGAVRISESAHPSGQSSEYHLQTENMHNSPHTSNFTNEPKHKPVPVSHFWKPSNLDLRYKANSVTELYKPMLPLKPALKKEISKSQGEISSLASDSKSSSPPPPPVNYSTLPKSPVSPSWEEIFQATPGLPKGERQPSTKFASMAESARPNQHAKVGYLTVTQVLNSFLCFNICNVSVT